MQGSKNKYAYEILKAKFFDNIKNIDDLIKKINKGFNFVIIEEQRKPKVIFLRFFVKHI